MPLNINAAAKPIGIIAGGGTAPQRLYAACQTLGRPAVVFALTGQCETAPWLTATTHHWLNLGEGEKLLAIARDAGIEELVFIGRVQRPSLSSLKADALTLKALGRIALKAFGDDSLLRAVADEFAREGFKVISATDIYQDWLAGAGLLCGTAPDKELWQDIQIGIKAAQILGQLDIGQSVVVQQGFVLGVEAIEGTALLLERCAKLKREGRAGVLVKLKKPQQDSRFDLPALGPDTIMQAKAAGLCGIICQAGATLLLEQDELLKQAQSANIFIYGLTASELAGG